jgi:hypothetical protein
MKYTIVVSSTHIFTHTYTSTKGTSAIAALKREGYILRTAPTSNPPANKTNKIIVIKGNRGKKLKLHYNF